MNDYWLTLKDLLKDFLNYQLLCYFHSIERLYFETDSFVVVAVEAIVVVISFAVIINVVLIDSDCFVVVAAVEIEFVALIARVLVVAH